MSTPENAPDLNMIEEVGEIPDKLYFRIGEVSDLVGVEAHVLRYWESEFGLHTKKSSTCQRMFRRKHHVGRAK